ncbi:hypothetical protein F4778DRAFT_551821 [Xylariomycetidae sp. FL2044]|nr:hypothetical protein F4778DRAFT_551821 [Xylariomycetidae sp. FL2044]
MATQKQTRKIALVGARGTIGSSILKALVSYGHTVTVLTRPSSDTTTPFPEGVIVVPTAYDDIPTVTNHLRGQEVLILALSFLAYDSQTPLIRAAADAGVPWVVPTEYGSDPTHPLLNAEIPLMVMKAPYRKQIEDLGVSSWIGVVDNPWLDFSLRIGALGIDFKTRTARLFGEGLTKANFTTLRRVGESLASLLTLPSEELSSKYRNAWVYFSSFHVTHRELLESAVRVSGTSEKDWAVTNVDIDETIRNGKEAMAKGDSMGGVSLLFALTFKEGYGGDYNDKVIDYKMLGLEPEDLDEVMKDVMSQIDV